MWQEEGYWRVLKAKKEITLAKTLEEKPVYCRIIILDSYKH